MKEGEEEEDRRKGGEENRRRGRSLSLYIFLNKFLYLYSDLDDAIK